MPAIPGQEILDTVDGRYRDMQGICGRLGRQRHAFEQGRGKRFCISRDLQERHVGYYTQPLRRGSRITCRAFADDEPRDVHRKPMAMPSPPLVRSLLVGSDPQDAAGLHREVADDRRFKVNGWMHQSPEKARQICQNIRDQRLATLDFLSGPILSRGRCIASFGLQGDQSLPLDNILPDLSSKTANECFP